MAGWVRVETRFISHPKVLDIGPLGEALWLRGLCYAGEQLTDGFVPASFIRRMGDLKGIVVADRLVAAGLWEEAEGGYRIHDYLDWQRSSDDARDISSKRADAGRRGGKQKASNMLANARQTPSKNVPDTYTYTEADTDTVSNDTGETSVSKAPLPEHGEAQRIVAAYCREAGIDAPANYGRAASIANKLVKAGITAEDVPSLFAAANWGDGADLSKMLGTVDRWRAAKHAPPKPQKYPEPLQKRIDLWTTERLNDGKPIQPFPGPLQSAIDDWKASLNGARP